MSHLFHGFVCLKDRDTAGASIQLAKFDFLVKMMSIVQVYSVSDVMSGACSM